jgi:hypothetical protein
VPHGKKKKAKDKRNGTRMKKKLVGGNHLSLQVKATGREYREEEWSCCFPGLLVVEADLKTDGWLLSSGYVSCCYCCCRCRYSFVSTVLHWSEKKLDVGRENWIFDTKSRSH